MNTKLTGTEIRQAFIDFFICKGHTFVQSSSLVPGGDQTLLFTNAGMVQFKDVFLGTDVRPYHRAVNSQKCMRVAGKHNDLDDVGRDDSHHTFFEMLGNWSFGDYYKKEAISWAWELLTGVWKIDPSILYTTCFKDDKGSIPADEEAATFWREQPGMLPDHILFCGRKDNFWEMAETGPCGPCSEIHIDRGEAYCNKKGQPGHNCRVNGDCTRYLEVWNLVFIQYNRVSETEFLPLPARHVDTGMGLDRIVAFLQGVDSNYRTDLFSPLMDKIRELTGTNLEQMNDNFTPYRVVADHVRACTFLIADGVVPGNTGRNYVCRMIIRRAARFGTKLGLNEPFLAEIAKVVIDLYGVAYPELEKNRKGILDNLTREEKRFQKTVEAGVSQLDELVLDLHKSDTKILDGKLAFELYATHGLPLEITRDILREVDLEVDEAGFRASMNDHKILSGAGKAFRSMGGEEVALFQEVFKNLVDKGLIDQKGVQQNPYQWLDVPTTLSAIISEGEVITDAQVGMEVEIIVPKTGFYVESGGQVGDTGWIVAESGGWEIEVQDVQKPAAGIIVHAGIVTKGNPRTGDKVRVMVDRERRMSTMRNHTATHLLHAQLHRILGDHARQAGSLVAPDRLRFDFTHPEAITTAQLDAIEEGVNQEILASHSLIIKEKTLQQAMEEGAMALFGEKYGQTVRTVTIDEEHPISYELCGGTHVENTGEIGSFVILSEGSAAAGIRRIEAVTGKGAYEVIHHRNQILRRAARAASTSTEDLVEKVSSMNEEIDGLRSEVQKVRQNLIRIEFSAKQAQTREIKGIPILAIDLPGADLDTLRQMTDLFRNEHQTGVVVLGSVINEKPMMICAITEDLVKKGLSAGEIVKNAAVLMGGSGGGKPALAQAGGKDPLKLKDALDSVYFFLSEKM